MGCPSTGLNPAVIMDIIDRVGVHEALSPLRVITCGVPQGSVLGARLIQ